MLGSTSISYFFHTSTFCQLLDKPRSQVSSFLPPGTYLQLLSHMGFSNLSARQFFIHEFVADSRSRALRKSTFAQEKVHANFYEYALWGALVLSASLFLHKQISLRIITRVACIRGGLELTKLTSTRLEDNLRRHRVKRSILCEGHCHDSVIKLNSQWCVLVPL